MTWVKLGKKATIFVDPITKMEVTSSVDPVEVPRMSKRIREAINGGHIIEVPESEISEETKARARSLKEKNDAETKAILGITPQEPAENSSKEKGNKGKTTKGKLKAMTVDQRAAFYQENYEDITDADIAAFKAMTEEEQVKFLLED